MRMVVGWVLAGGMGAVALAACRNEAAGPDPAGGCTASCAEAIAVGGEPCAFDAPGLAAYQELAACAAQVAGGDSDAGVSTDGGILCGEVAAQMPPSPECILAIEHLMPPCSSAPHTCMQN